MTDADAFLDAIFDAPWDDVPRLVYADWLEEHGQGTYAEFIRLQCEIARLPVFSAEATELWKRISPVWRRLEDEWWPISYVLRPLDAINFQRGFYASTFHADGVHHFGSRVIWLSPLYFPKVCVSLWASPLPDPLEELLERSGLFDCCHTLELVGQPTAEFYQRALFQRVRVLDLVESTVHQDHFEALAANPSLARLRRLRLSRVWDRESVEATTFFRAFGGRVEFAESKTGWDME